MLVLIGDRRTEAYSMYGVDSAIFSFEGRRCRGASAASSAAVVATSFGAMFADNEATAENLWEVCDPEAFDAFLDCHCQNHGDLQSGLMA